MPSYKSRLSEDLDRWIAAGWVPAPSRERILASVAEPRRLDAATALGFLGALLLGVAVIAFVAANWDVLNRLTRFGVILAAFGLSAGGAAWAASRGRLIVCNALLLVAALVFAAAIGLTGQIFDLAGDPQAALRGAGLAALLLALAGHSSGAALAAVVLTGLGDGPWEGDPGWVWLAGVSAVVLSLAWRWRSVPTAHAAGLGLFAAGVLLAAREHHEAWFLAASAIAAAAAFGLRRYAPEQRFGGVLFGWAAIAALIYFAAAGVEVGGGERGLQILHRIVLLLLAGGALALGRHDRHGALTAAAVLALLWGISALLFDLGFGLMTAAGVFLLCALLALVGGFVLRPRTA